MKKETIYWARKCDISGKGMNEGYCINDGGMYIKYEKDMVEWLRSKDWEFENEYGLIINVAKLDDYELLEWAFNDEVFYWTEWFEKEDVQYKEIGGKLIKEDGNNCRRCKDDEGYGRIKLCNSCRDDMRS